METKQTNNRMHGRYLFDDFGIGNGCCLFIENVYHDGEDSFWVEVNNTENLRKAPIGFLKFKRVSKDNLIFFVLDQIRSVSCPLQQSEVECKDALALLCLDSE